MVLTTKGWNIILIETLKYVCVSQVMHAIDKKIYNIFKLGASKLKFYNCRWKN